MQAKKRSINEQQHMQKNLDKNSLGNKLCKNKLYFT